MFKWFSCVAVGVVVCLAIPGFAADRSPKKEAGQRERKPPTAERVFKKIGSDHNGKITLDEFKVYYEKWHGLIGPVEAAAPTRKARAAKSQKAALREAQLEESTDPAARCPVWQGQEEGAKVAKRSSGVH